MIAPLATTVLLVAATCASAANQGWSADAPAANATYQRLKKSLDSVPAIDTHDHLWPFELLPGRVESERGNGMTLASLWRSSYLGWINPITPWKSGGTFDDWWPKAKHDFDNVRATSFYRYTLPAIQDLYGLDFETITDAQAGDLSDRIFANYRDQKWLYHVITERANIELIVNDPYWAPYGFRTNYAFEATALRLNPVFRGFHPSEFPKPSESLYRFAQKEGLQVASLDDYLMVLDRLVQRAKEAGAVCLKQTLAYQRSLRFERVSKEAAAKAFGHSRDQLTPQEIQDFEDFIMWRLCELSARHGLPFQIHTGYSRIQGSSPMLLVDLIAANPKTQFVLLHGGFPWVSETGMIAARHKNVWIDSVWLPTISYHTAQRAFHEWLDVLPSDRILWGGDCNHAEGIYGATEFTRRCLAEVLAERVNRGKLKEEHALHIGRQILRDNALKLFPQLTPRLWKHKGKLEPTK